MNKILVSRDVLFGLMYSHSRLSQAEYERNKAFNDSHFSAIAEHAIVNDLPSEVIHDFVVWTSDKEKDGQPMIHVNTGYGQHEWLTQRQFEKKYPEVAKMVSNPYAEQGGELHRKRIECNMTVREMAKLTNCTASYLCDVELGRTLAPMDLVEEYRRLEQRETEAA